MDESTKDTREIFVLPISGEVIENNKKLLEIPAMFNDCGSVNQG